MTKMDPSSCASPISVILRIPYFRHPARSERSERESQDLPEAAHLARYCGRVSVPRSMTKNP